MLRLSLPVVAGLLIVACQSPTLEVQLPLAVVSWSPQDGASGVCPTWPVSVCFNEPLDPTKLTGNVLLGTAQQCMPGSPITNGGTVNAQLQLASDVEATGSPNCVVLTPTGPLAVSTCYTIEVEGEDLGAGVGVAGLADGGSVFLPVTLRSLFQTALDDTSCIGTDGG